MKTRSDGIRRILISFFFTLANAAVFGVPDGCAAQAGTATAQAADTLKATHAPRKATKRVRRARWHWDSDLSARSFYDNNILDYSARDRRRFRDRTHPNKFSINSLDDWINELGAHVGLRHGSRSRGEYRLRFLAEADLYATNAIKNSVRYETEVRWAHQDQSLTARVGWTPHFYLRDLIVHDSALAHPGSPLYANVNYHVWNADAELRFRWALPAEQRLAGGWKRTDYSPKFNERDNTSWWGRYGWVVALSEHWSTSLSYQFLSLDAAGAHDSIAVSDISQHEQTIAGGVDVDLTTNMSGSIVLTYEHQRYTSVKASDVSHMGRRDDEWRIYTEFGTQLAHGWRALVFERWTSATSNTPLATDLGAFVDNQVGLRFTRSW